MALRFAAHESLRVGKGLTVPPILLAGLVCVVVFHSVDVTLFQRSQLRGNQKGRATLVAQARSAHRAVPRAKPVPQKRVQAKKHRFAQIQHRLRLLERRLAKLQQQMAKARQRPRQRSRLSKKKNGQRSNRPRTKPATALTSPARSGSQSLRASKVESSPARKAVRRSPAPHRKLRASSPKRVQSRAQVKRVPPVQKRPSLTAQSPRISPKTKLHKPARRSAKRPGAVRKALKRVRDKPSWPLRRKGVRRTPQNGR